MSRSSVPERTAAPGFAAVYSDDGYSDDGLEDELLNVSPLSTIISPLPHSDSALPVSPSRYPEPPASLLSPVQLRVVNTLPSIDLFPSYTLSPAHSCYAPATSLITTDVPDTSEYLSPGSLAAMDQFLVGDAELLLDCSSDLPMLPLPLLPLPVSSVLPPESDLSRDGPFDAGQSVSVSGAAPSSWIVYRVVNTG